MLALPTHAYQSRTIESTQDSNTQSVALKPAVQCANNVTGEGAYTWLYGRAMQWRWRVTMCLRTQCTPPPPLDPQRHPPPPPSSSLRVLREREREGEVHYAAIIHFKKISNQVLVLKSMKMRAIWTAKYIEWLVRTRQIVLWRFRNNILDQPLRS